jgi:hypothetical protein
MQKGERYVRVYYNAPGSGGLCILNTSGGDLNLLSMNGDSFREKNRSSKLSKSNRSQVKPAESREPCKDLWGSWQIYKLEQMFLVIVTHIWQKLSSVELEVTLIVIDFWQLFSQIIGQTSFIVTQYWRNPTSSRVFTIIHSSL